jgi:hypothetical protein
VMLQRLRAMGVTTDAATNDDFRRVRNLPGWAEFGNAAAGAETALGAGKASATDTAGVKASATDTAGKANRTDVNEAVQFEMLPFTPAGLAYDAVSRRFIVGDRRARRLAVIDEFSGHMANLASAQSAGFGEIAAIEIDPRRGDLWVLSTEGARATLHKLQLISGRALASYAPSDRFGPVDLIDVAATPDNGVLVLDRAGHRIFQLGAKATALELTSTLPDDKPVAIAPAGDGVAYLAHASGVSRVDLPARSVVRLKPRKGVDLKRITKLRWHKGALIAVQGADDGSYRAVRIELDRQGRGAVAIRPLAASLDPTAVTISGATLYYLAAADDARMTVGKLLLK